MKNDRREGTPSGFRVVWAIASKDIVDALRSMTTVSLILGTMVLILSSQAMPLLLGGSGELSLIVYDPGATRLVQALSYTDGVLVKPVDSLDELWPAVTLDPRRAIGIDVPPGIDETLDSVNLVQHQYRQIRRLSGGQIKRASWANEAICNPSLIFLDEVTSGLDEQTDSEMMQLFRLMAEAGAGGVHPRTVRRGEPVRMRLQDAGDVRAVTFSVPGRQPEPVDYVAEPGGALRAAAEGVDVNRITWMGWDGENLDIFTSQFPQLPDTMATVFVGKDRSILAVHKPVR